MATAHPFTHPSTHPSKGSASKSPSAKTAPFPKGVSQPAIRALASAGYLHLHQLVNASKRELAKLHGMGQKALRILGDALKAQDKSFKP
jgi:hypothetical protein